MSARPELLGSLAQCLRLSSPLRFRDEAERSYLGGFFEKGFPENARSVPKAAPDGNDIRSIIESCSMCSGTGERKMPFGNGSGRLMIVLNPPALLSSFELTYFKKESKDILFKILKNALLIEPENAYITNLLKCTLKEAVRPSEFYDNCMHILEKEIELVNPRTVLVMGDMLPLRRVRKKSPQCNWFEVPHPVAMIQTPELKRPAWETLKLVKSTLDE